jgi:hypothetical protein
VLVGFREKESRILKLHLENRLERCLSNPDQFHCSEGRLYSHTFTRDEYDQLRSTIVDPDERSARAIDLLGKRIDVDDELAVDLREAYSLS